MLEKKKSNFKMSITRMTRTRLKLTIWSMVFVAIVASYAAYVLWLDHFNQGAWTCLGGSLVAWTTAVGLYVNHDTKRPSYQNNTVTQVTIPNAFDPTDKSESDPEEMPV